mmetsp:Transcript_46663/g.77185  ORF Transcript_46663/g.77185 Transcript_46663/m.77185 type:complete len:93 (+) Transcript_46663:579-857(+)
MKGNTLIILGEVLMHASQRDRWIKSMHLTTSLGRINLKVPLSPNAYGYDEARGLCTSATKAKRPVPASTAALPEAAQQSLNLLLTHCIRCLR